MRDWLIYDQMMVVVITNRIGIIGWMLDILHRRSAL